MMELKQVIQARVSTAFINMLMTRTDLHGAQAKNNVLRRLDSGGTRGCVEGVVVISPRRVDAC